MTELISISENKESDKEVILEKPELEYIQKQFEKFLNKEKEDRKFLSFNQITPNSYKIQAHSWIGTVQLNNKYRVQINPKISIKNFLKMLNYVNKDLVLLSDKLAKFEKEDDLIRYFIKIFLKKVESLITFHRWKSYVAEKENLSNIKGKPLLKENIQQNKILHHKIYCEYDEFTDDTIFNQIIKYTLFKMQFIVEEKATKKNIGKIYSLFNRISLKPFEIYQIDKLVYNNLNINYKPIHKLCKFFIKNIFISHSLGTYDFYCFLINMYSFFEEFVRRCFHLFSPYTVLPPDIEIRKKGGIEKKPDIRLKKYGQFQLIIDCKYKTQRDPLDQAQIYEYLEIYNTNRGVLVYPKDFGNDKITEIIIPYHKGAEKVYVKLIDLDKINDVYLKSFVDEIVNLSL